MRTPGFAPVRRAGPIGVFQNANEGAPARRFEVSGSAPTADRRSMGSRYEDGSLRVAAAVRLRAS